MNNNDDNNVSGDYQAPNSNTQSTPPPVNQQSVDSNQPTQQGNYAPPPPPEQVLQGQPTYSQPQQQDNSTNDVLAIVGAVLGAFNLCSWCIPLCGVPLGLIGIVVSFLGMKSEKNKTIAIVGLVLSSIGFILAIVNGIVGFAVAVTDTN